MDRPGSYVTGFPVGEEAPLPNPFPQGGEAGCAVLSAPQEISLPASSALVFESGATPDSLSPVGRGRGMVFLQTRWLSNEEPQP